MIDRIDRYPAEFVEDHWPAGFEARDHSAMSADERKNYFSALGNAIEADKRVYRRIMSRVRDAVDLSVKRVQWNFKTAVPQYYPPVRRLQLLLPLARRETDQRLDLAIEAGVVGIGEYDPQSGGDCWGPATRAVRSTSRSSRRS